MKKRKKRRAGPFVFIIFFAAIVFVLFLLFGDTLENGSGVPLSGGKGYYGERGVYIQNETDYKIDISKMLDEPLEFEIDTDKPQVLIIHTHGSESFDQSDGQAYEETDPWRTTDKEHNVMKLGDVIAEEFEGRGIKVVHDTEFYDYPAYEGAYDRAEEAIRAHLKKYPEIKVVLDIHRDAFADSDGSAYKTSARVNGKECAQIMIVSGSDYSGLKHPEWQENLKFAFKIQETMNEKYPSLARPVKLSQYRYNQQFTAGSLIIEVGSNGNTLSEAIDAVGYFADAAADVLLKTDK